MKNFRAYRYYMALSFLMILLSCQKGDEDMSNINVTQLKEALCDTSTDVYMCTEYPLEAEDAEDTELRAALVKGKKWKTGETIRVKFLNGGTYFQDKVKLYASYWLEHANLNFEYVEPNDKADIKIAFKWDCDYSSWSYIGTDCKKISQYKPSMNFGWFSEYTSSAEFRRVILHEFGHALGLIHEHQHPEANIQWNKTAVYDYYESIEGWDRKSIENNLFKKYTTSQTNYSQFDPESIMLYSISSDLTLDGFSVGWNHALSETDKNFIAGIYPY